MIMNTNRGGTWRWTLVPLVGLALGWGFPAASAAASTVTSESAAVVEPVPAPPATLTPDALGADGQLDDLAASCYGGAMQACDDLYGQAPAGSAYEAYGDSCAGRQPQGSQQFCTNVFSDASFTPVPEIPEQTPVIPQQVPVNPEESPVTPTTVSETDMFGAGATTGSTFPACPVLTYLNDELGCSPTATPLPPQTIALATDAVCPVEGDLEHPVATDETMFTFPDPSQMKTLIECILPEAVAWMTWEYGSLDVPAAWAGSQATSLLPNNFVYVPTGVRGAVSDETCISEDADGEYAYDDWSLAYCPVDGNIYLGEQAVWYGYQHYGDADLWGTIGHEWGHRIQHVAGIPNESTPSEVIPLENQADCVSGAFLDYAARFGYVDSVVTGGDLDDLFVGLFDIGEQPGDQRTHGTIDQRIRAFFVGYNSPDSLGAWACDFYVTSGSIIPPGADADVSPSDGGGS